MTDRLAPLVAFFERERDRRPVRGLLIVLASASIGLVGGLALLFSVPEVDQPMLAFATGAGTVETGAAQLVGAIVTVAFPILAWLVYAAIAHGLTALADGDGGFYRFATLLAWGWVPSLLVSLAWVAVLLVNVATTPAPETLTPGCAYCQQIRSGPLMAAVRTLDVVAIPASGVVWAGAIEVGRDVSRRVAIVGAGLLAAFNAGFFLAEVLLV